MPAHTLERPENASAAATTGGARRTYRRLALVTVVYTYLLIVFGGMVRITGSGLGCGDDWPRCNGQWIPAFDFATLIEYMHRLLVASLALPFGAFVLYALLQRREAGFAGKGGLLRPALAAAALLIAQVLLGALTVKLDLPAGVTALHFVNASLLVAALVVGAVRAADGAAGDPANAGFARTAVGAAVLGLIVVALGALTANTGLAAASAQPSGAAFACQGFPLCNGQLFPRGGAWVHIHWTHRLLAFLLFFHVLGAFIAARRRGAPAAVTRMAGVTCALVGAQIAVAAGLVLLRLPDSLQAVHLAVGVALWAALVAWAAVARRHA